MEVVGTMHGKDFRHQWVALNSTSQVYVGQLVYDVADGIAGIGQASGAADTTNKRVPLGVVIGTSNDVPVSSTTSNSETITGVITQADQIARANIGVEGPNPKGDKQAFAKIALVTAQTVLKVKLYNASLGTAPTLQTVTTGSTTGLGYTANATDVAGVADLATAFCRTGANAGLYRITDDTSTTVITNDRAFQQDIAVGDTFVRVPLRPQGLSFVQTDSNALFFDVSATPATNYWVINTLELNLKEAGKEYVLCTLHPDHFSSKRA
ncbi:MAG: hypothetical protein ACE5DX_05600 [Candidatus Dojkabacteria bacterium]